VTSLGVRAAPLSADEVEGWRQRFPILAHRTYLANHSLGAMPAAARGSLGQFADEWAQRGVEAWPEWLAEVRRVADLIGSLIGAPAGTVVVHQNVASLTAMFLTVLPRDDGRTRALLASDEWPGHRYLLAEHRRLGLEPVVVPTWEDLLAAIDERTALVLTSHVRFRDARILDVAAIVARARQVGALVLADGYHAAGLLPVDVVRLGVDGYVGGSVKWLCGGPGVGWLYLRPEARLRPAVVGWLAHARPFAFEPDWEATEGALAWLGGTPGMPALYAAREGYRIIAEVTPARVRATSEVLTAHLVEGARARGFEVRTALDPAERGGTVTIDLGARTVTVAERLSRAGVVVDTRPNAGIRVGAHFFNTVEECELVLEEVSRL
jgi:kynureninase